MGREQEMLNKLVSIYPKVKGRLTADEIMFIALKQFQSCELSEEEVKTLEVIWEKVPEAHGVTLSPKTCLWTRLKEKGCIDG